MLLLQRPSAVQTLCPQALKSATSNHAPKVQQTLHKLHKSCINWLLDEILPVDITQSVDESEPTEASESTEPSASSDSQEAYSSTVIPTDDATETTESGAGDDDDEDVEYEIVEADTCEDGEWVEAEDVTVRNFLATITTLKT